MEFVADLHLHSKYSRAVSPNMTLPVMASYARMKGLHVLSASDWTHPLWFKEIKAQLVEVSEGLYKLKGEEKDPQSPNFLLSVEVSNIYSQGGKTRKIHNLLFVPNFETAEKVNMQLNRRGAKLLSDGRPIMGLSSREVLEIILEANERSFLIPAHVWTPHFGIFGSASGFDTLTEAFGDLAKYIYGIETGLSSDPIMNWQIKELDTRSILSFSDAHSAAKMGREATIFVPTDKLDTSRVITYDDMRLAIMGKKGKLKIGYTLEFYPEEGKYHYSGHRNCNVIYTPEETLAKGNICPVCARPLTEGVMYRVEQVAHGKENLTFTPEIKENSYGLMWKLDQANKRPPFLSLVPLIEIIAESLHSTTSSQKVKDLYAQLTKSLGNEIEILLRCDISEIEKRAGGRLAEGIQLVRKGSIVIKPGYDGVYGVVKIWPDSGEAGIESGEEEAPQLGLF